MAAIDEVDSAQAGEPGARLLDLRMALGEQHQGMHNSLHVLAVLDAPCAAARGPCEAGGVYRVLLDLPPSVFADPLELRRTLPPVELLLATDVDAEAMTVGAGGGRSAREHELLAQRLALQVAVPAGQGDGGPGQRRQRQQLELAIPIHTRYHAARPAHDAALFHEVSVPWPRLQHCPRGGGGACAALPPPPHVLPAAPVQLRFPAVSLGLLLPIRALTDVVVTLTLLVVAASLAGLRGRGRGRGSK